MARTTELRLPAHRDYLVVAKRSAAAVGTVAGFDMDAIDDLTIAVSQAMEEAIACLERSSHAGEVRLTFKEAPRGLEVTVRSTVSREAVTAVSDPSNFVAVEDLALRLMGLFVDDSSYRVDEHTGSLRVRLTKYRIS